MQYWRCWQHKNFITQLSGATRSLAGHAGSRVPGGRAAVAPHRECASHGAAAAAAAAVAAAGLAGRDRDCNRLESEGGQAAAGGPAPAAALPAEATAGCIPVIVTGP